jgi:hypothetical protein
MHAKVWSKNLKGEQGVDGEIILNWILKKWDEGVD